MEDESNKFTVKSCDNLIITDLNQNYVFEVPMAIGSTLWINLIKTSGYVTGNNCKTTF